MKLFRSLIMGLLCIAATAAAQDRPPLFTVGNPSDSLAYEKVKIGMEARFDFAFDAIEHEHDEAGFHGRYLNIMLDGHIIPQLSYHWRQRLNKFGEMKNDVFGATDWIYLDWSPSSHWNLTAGKMVLDVGGYEYDNAPINEFFSSLFWNHFACYQFGVGARYNFNGGKHSLSFQFTNSPYADRLGDSNFAYNLMWRGHMGFFHTLWSVNLMQYGHGHLAQFISLGNRFEFGNFYLDLDLQNRHSRHEKFWFGDWFCIAKANFRINHHFDIFAKGGYERWKPEFEEPEAIECPLYGAGVEYYPLRNSRDLRIHAAVDLCHDDNDTRRLQAQIGITWKMDIFSWR